MKVSQVFQVPETSRGIDFCQKGTKSPDVEVSGFFDRFPWFLVSFQGYLGFSNLKKKLDKFLMLYSTLHALKHPHRIL